MKLRETTLDKDLYEDRAIALDNLAPSTLLDKAVENGGTIGIFRDLKQGKLLLMVGGHRYESTKLELKPNDVPWIINVLLKLELIETKGNEANLFHVTEKGHAAADTDVMSPALI